MRKHTEGSSWGWEDTGVRKQHRWWVAFVIAVTSLTQPGSPKELPLH